MSELTNPSDIARETLRQLASRRIAPNPDNYRQHYQQIAGQPDAAADAERMLQQLAAELRAQPNTARLAGALDKAAGEKNWPQYRAALLQLIDASSGQGAAAPLWAQLILDLIRQWESHHSGLTTARKRESLERVLGVPGSDAAGLAAKLQKLVKSWSQTAPAPAEQTDLAPTGAAQANAGDAAVRRAAAPATAAGAPPGGEDALVQLRDLLAQTLEFAVITQLGHAPDLAEEAGGLANAARAAAGNDAIAKLTAALRKFWYKLEVRGGENAELHQGLLRLLRLLIDNTHELLGEDQWLRGQVALLQKIVTRPLDLGAIAEAESRLKEVIHKQGTLKSSLQEAKSALKRLITSFIDRLGGLSESTDGYHTRLEGYAQKIRQADDIKQLNVVLEDLLEDTRSVQLDAVRTRDALLAARRQVEAAELKVRELEGELDKVSGLVQEDQLTGVLNRRGLEDAFDREAARAERAGTSLCVGMLDIDNFKLLNDTHGHQAGDDALQHLVRVIKRTMRPTDVLARYGGEEFMLLLPDTQQDEAVEVMVRLQRNLTKAFFLHDNERVLITFSAGVALRQEAEPQSAITERADKALYQAKRSGKNRVCSA
ncbi:MAG: diguanylate cyclase [Burkholderiales bacterium]